MTGHNSLKNLSGGVGLQVTRSVKSAGLVSETERDDGSKVLSWKATLRIEGASNYAIAAGSGVSREELAELVDIADQSASTDWNPVMQVDIVKSGDGYAIPLTDIAHALDWRVGDAIRVGQYSSPKQADGILVMSPTDSDREVGRSVLARRAEQVGDADAAARYRTAEGD